MAAGHPGKKNTESPTESPTTIAPEEPTLPSVPGAPSPSEVVARVQATVAQEEIREAQAAAAVEFEIERAQNVIAEEEAQRAIAAEVAQNSIDFEATEAVRRDTEEALAVMSELDTIGSDLAPHESRYYGGWGGGYPGWGGYPAYNAYPGYAGVPSVGGWGGAGAGGYYGGYNPFRRNYYQPQPYYGGYGGGKSRRNLF